VSSLEAVSGEAAPQRILVIKLGALGDFVQALGPMQAIRAAHPGARIALLTTPPFVALAEQCPWFDEVIPDPRPRLRNLAGWIALRRRLRAGRFDRVYDLQTSDRTGWYYRLMAPGKRPDWSGVVPGALRHANPARDRMHTLDRQAEQLAAAGIARVPPPDLYWVEADLARFDLPRRFVLLVPGASAHRPAKRWPAERFAALARDIAARGAKPVVVGVAAEKPLAAAICGRCHEARDLTGETSLLELFALARRASGAVGNDSGPMHVAAAAGAPSVVLFSSESDPALCAPRGPSVIVIRRPELTGLGVAEVAGALKLR
jgi:ADP-heptose:LPS heptosyltransferase